MIAVRNLKKQFGSLDVLQGIDVTIPTGRITGIVGPNAAGKTTLIKSVLGLTRADSGSIEVDGVRVNGDETYRSKIGYMPQTAHFPSNLTGGELLTMLRELRPDATDLDEDLIGLDHAQFHARLLLDHLQALLQVAHLGGQALVGLLRQRVPGLLVVELALHLRDVADTAPSEPELRVQHQQQEDEQGGDEAAVQEGGDAYLRL